jgi:hypothetical protein
MLWWQFFDIFFTKYLALMTLNEPNTEAHLLHETDFHKLLQFWQHVIYFCRRVAKKSVCDKFFISNAKLNIKNATMIIKNAKKSEIFYFLMTFEICLYQHFEHSYISLVTSWMGCIYYTVDGSPNLDILPPNVSVVTDVYFIPKLWSKTIIIRQPDGRGCQVLITVGVLCIRDKDRLYKIDLWASSQQARVPGGALRRRHVALAPQL